MEWGTMEILEARIGRTAVLRLSGELDRAYTEALLEHALAHVRETGRLVLDCSHLTYVDSAGIAVLYRLLEELGGREGAWLALLNPGRNVLRILDLAGLVGAQRVWLFESRQELEQAVTSWGEQR